MCLGIVIPARKRQDVAYIVGGVLLEVYALSIADIIFAPLQLAFIAAAAYDLRRLRKADADQQS